MDLRNFKLLPFFAECFLSFWILSNIWHLAECSHGRTFKCFIFHDLGATMQTCKAVRSLCKAPVKNLLFSLYRRILQRFWNSVKKTESGTMGSSSDVLWRINCFLTAVPALWWWCTYRAYKSDAICYCRLPTVTLYAQTASEFLEITTFWAIYISRISTFIRRRKIGVRSRN